MARYDAYIFDVQGTLVDFYKPVADALTDALSVTDCTVPVGDIVRAWRRDYFSRVTALEQSASNWHPVQDAYTTGLTAVCEELGVSIPPEQHATLAGAWKRLIPWPDVAEGLRHVRSEATIATLSNTDMATMVQLFKSEGIDWDAILTAEVFGAFKPEPLVYERMCRFLGVRPENAAMVASHPYDLRAAREVGLNTVFVYRPYEFGRLSNAVDDGIAEFDHRIDDIRDLP